MILDPIIFPQELWVLIPECKPRSYPQALLGLLQTPPKTKKDIRNSHFPFCQYSLLLFLLLLYLEACTEVPWQPIYSGFTLGSVQGTMYDDRIELGTATCKASTLFSVLSLRHPTCNCNWQFSGQRALSTL